MIYNLTLKLINTKGKIFPSNTIRKRNDCLFYEYFLDNIPLFKYLDDFFDQEESILLEMTGTLGNYTNFIHDSILCWKLMKKPIQLDILNQLSKEYKIELQNSIFEYYREKLQREKITLYWGPYNFTFYRHSGKV